MSVEPFNRLVKLAARAFYDDITTKGDNQPKTGRSDNRGIAVVVLDALTRRQWVREEDLAKDLKLHSKQLRRTLRFFEEEKLVTRDHRRETAKGAKIYSAAIAATGDGQQTKEGDEKIKLHTHSYCCLDYAQIYDVVRYRLHRMKKKLKDELEDKNTVQEYICPNCGKRYNALDALRLISMEDEYFHCESCNGELVAESDKLASQEIGDGDDNARRRRREKLKDMLQKMEDAYKNFAVYHSFGVLEKEEEILRMKKNRNNLELVVYSRKKVLGRSKDQLIIPTHGQPKALGNGSLNVSGGNLVTWRSKKQNVFARSSAEAEFRAIAHGICEIMWIRRLLEELKMIGSSLMKLYCDNKAAISVTHNPVLHDCTKHVEVDKHFIKEKIDNGLVCMTYIPTEEQVADVFTKGLYKRQFDFLVGKLAMEDIFKPA